MKTPCDHIVGCTSQFESCRPEYQCVMEPPGNPVQLLRLSYRNLDLLLVAVEPKPTLWKFCPLCGEDISALTVIKTSAIAEVKP